MMSETRAASLTALSAGHTSGKGSRACAEVSTNCSFDRGLAQSTGAHVMMAEGDTVCLSNTAGSRRA
jgi:hypothetical protein